MSGDREQRSKKHRYFWWSHEAADSIAHAKARFIE
jgi:hypothetical protein